MAANPSTIVTSPASQHDFTRSLAWTTNSEITLVLSDIPLISVGILAFGVSILFFVVRRVSISTVWLFSSVLLAFVAAVVDLGKSLADESVQSATFVASDPATRAREILLALSVGLRLLFYWSHAAEPPRKDLSVASSQRVRKSSLRILEHTHELHNGSWMRWGLAGKLIGVGLLTAVVTITTLQITWRVVPRFHQYSGVYATAAALELLVSFLLLLKLLSNTVNDNNLPNSMLVHTCKECLAPISGLLINIAVGVGALLSFSFTESTTGRLLQAFEVCVIVVFVVVTAILKDRDILLAATSQSEERRHVEFTLPEPVRGSTFRINTPHVETPRLSTLFGSSWLYSRVSRNRSRRRGEEAKLWNPEKGEVGPPYAGSIDTDLRANVMSTQESEGWNDPVREAAPASYLTIVTPPDAWSAIAQSMAGSIHSGQTQHPPRADVPRLTVPPQDETGPAPVSSVPPSISSRVKHTRSIAIPIPPQDSPVYGLGGIRSAASPSSPQASLYALNELLRQQKELEQNIETLNSFSKRTSTDSNAVLSSKSVELSRSPSTGASDISLSSFPIPPRRLTPVPPIPPSPSLSTIKRMRGDKRVRLTAARTAPAQDMYPLLRSGTPASLVDIPSSPHVNSLFGGENESFLAEARMFSGPDSGGYNVTSFINGSLFAASHSSHFGGLATPGESGRGDQEGPRWRRESRSSIGTNQTNSTMKVPPRTLPVPGRIVKSSPLAPSISSPGDTVDEPAKYRINGQTTTSNITFSSPAPFTDRLENDMSLSSPPPQLAEESGLPRALLAERAARGQRVFVRPRPPPIAIKSYVERNPSKPPVQVLDDDLG